MSIADELEAAARANYSKGEGFASRAIGIHTISCQVISAMVNRGAVKRATWRLNGRRVSRDAVDRFEAQAGE